MYCAIFYWYLTYRIERAEQLTEELAAYLSVRSNYVSLLDQTTHGADIWTLGDLEHYVAEWTNSSHGEKSRWADVARDAGSEDFARLLIAKGRELDLLKRTEYMEGRSLIEQFSLSLGAAKP
jgi:hypothetical protein